MDHGSPLVCVVLHLVVNIKQKIIGFIGIFSGAATKNTTVDGIVRNDKKTFFTILKV